MPLSLKRFPYLLYLPLFLVIANNCSIIYTCTMIIRKANLADIGTIKRIADANKDTLGFVTKPALQFGIEKGWLLVAEENNIAGFVHYRHRRNQQTTIYEICVDRSYRGQGIGRLLIDTLVTEARGLQKAYIQLKAIQNIPANIFYEKYGFSLVGVETGRKRALNVWRFGIGAGFPG